MGRKAEHVQLSSQNRAESISYGVDIVGVRNDLRDKCGNVTRCIDRSVAKRNFDRGTITAQLIRLCIVRKDKTAVYLVVRSEFRHALASRRERWRQDVD